MTAETLALRPQKQQQQQALGRSEQLRLKVTQQKLQSADCINGSSSNGSNKLLERQRSCSCSSSRCLQHQRSSSQSSTCPYSAAITVAKKTIALQAKEHIKPITTRSRGRSTWEPAGVTISFEVLTGGCDLSINGIGNQELPTAAQYKQWCVPVR